MEDNMIVEEFLNYLKFEKRFSEHTAKCYGTDLVQFGDFLLNRSGGGGAETTSMSGGTAVSVATQPEVKKDQMLLAVDVNLVRGYMVVLNEKQYSKATIARKLATLRSFYKFLVKRGRIEANPVISIRTPKQEKKLPHFLEYEEVKRLLETPPLDNWLGARDRA
ncbi:MAG: site-specific integrase, partial [Sedimentisphaerales bacterium]|nr:site-specific integrase [Sedimentisphaerales bacterium]